MLTNMSMGLLHWFSSVEDKRESICRIFIEMSTMALNLQHSIKELCVIDLNCYFHDNCIQPCHSYSWQSSLHSFVPEPF